jgi:hypothetical protein
LQFSDFFRMRLMAERAGLWLDADVLLLKPIEIDPAKPYFAWERRRQLGNSVLYLPANDPIVRAFQDLMEQEDLTPDWLALASPPHLHAAPAATSIEPLADIRVAIYGPAAITALARRSGGLQHALPKQSFYAVHAEPKLFFEPTDFSDLLTDPKSLGCTSRQKAAVAKSRPRAGLYAWAAEKFGK